MPRKGAKSKGKGRRSTWVRCASCGDWVRRYADHHCPNPGAERWLNKREGRS